MEKRLEEEKKAEEEKLRTLEHKQKIQQKRKEVKNDSLCLKKLFLGNNKKRKS